MRSTETKWGPFSQAAYGNDQWFKSTQLVSASHKSLTEMTSTCCVINIDGNTMEIQYFMISLYYIYIIYILKVYIYIYASPPQDPYFYTLAFPKTYNTVHPVHLACLEAKYLVPEGFTVLRIFFFNRALPGSSC